MIRKCDSNNATIEILVYSWNHDVLEYENEEQCYLNILKICLRPVVGLGSDFQ